MPEEPFIPINCAAEELFLPGHRMKLILWIDHHKVAWEKKPNEFAIPYLNINDLIKSREDELTMDYIARFLIGYEEELAKNKEKAN